MAILVPEVVCEWQAKGTRMSGGVLEAIVADANLLQAWLVSEARLGEEPVPHAEVMALRDGLLANLAAIGTALRSGTWEPGPVRRATIAKSDGGQRVLHIPPLVDRVAERAIAAVLTVYLDPQLQPDSYGFRPGLGVEDATGALREQIADGQRWVIRTDIEECVASIRVEQCLAELALAVDDPAVLALVAKAARRSVGERAGIGLVQGSPLSPILVKHFLDGLDRAGWDEGVSVIRYVDDIAVTASSRAEAERQLVVLRRLAKQRGLTLTPHKTRIVRAADGVDFLGTVVRSATVGAGARLTDPARATVHITRRGSALWASGSRFVVTGAGRNFRHPAGRTRMIVCADRVLITSAALGLAARSGVGLVVVDPQHEHLIFLSPNSGRYEVLRAQYAAEDDPAHARTLAAAMVRAKIANGRILLTRTKSRRDAVPHPTAARLDRLRDHYANATTIAGLHGIEGAASRIYFDSLRALIPADWGFVRRNRRHRKTRSTPCCPTATLSSPPRPATPSNSPASTRPGASSTPVIGAAPASLST